MQTSANNKKSNMRISSNSNESYVILFFLFTYVSAISVHLVFFFAFSEVINTKRRIENLLLTNYKKKNRIGFFKLFLLVKQKIINWPQSRALTVILVL